MTNQLHNQLNQSLNHHSDDKQRTDEWFKQRMGRFTGSEIFKLMTCSRATSKMEWGRPEKLVDFGDTAIKYIFSKCKEKQRGKVVRTQSSKAMDYGTKFEKVVKQMLKLDIEEVGFIEFIKGVAGASPDGKCDDYGIEIKCATGWDGLYDRHEEEVDQSHKDFWQLQSEMMSLKFNKMMYVVAEPPEDMSNPIITDLSIKWVHASPIHQEAIYKRCEIGGKVRDLWLSYDGKKTVRDCLREVV